MVLNAFLYIFSKFILSSNFLNTNFVFFSFNNFISKTTFLIGRFPLEATEEISLPALQNQDERLLIALNTFQTEVQDDLSFNKGFYFNTIQNSSFNIFSGDFIVLEKSVDSCWGWGRCNETCGMFPFNHTYKLDDNSDDDVIMYVEVLYPFTSQFSNEMNLNPNEIISVTQILSDGWAKGFLGGRSGEFPLSFTREVEEIKRRESEVGSCPQTQAACFQTLLFDDNQATQNQFTSNSLPQQADVEGLFLFFAIVLVRLF